jgi:hypothetical protein
MTKRKQQDEYVLTDEQILLRIHLRELGIDTIYEHTFHPDRAWRFDLCNLDARIAFEISGGKRSGGHRRGNAQDDEYDKLNTAQMMGWRVFQFTNEQVNTGKAKEFIKSWH